jgi:serine/threonine-protein kinase
MEEFVRERIGQTLGGRWVLQSVLGVGGMAAVYAATDPVGQEAAVKILHPEIGRRRELCERFMREGMVANRIQHPGVVRVLEHGAVDERLVFLVLERLHGESLGERVAREGMLPLPDLLDVLEQVLDVLAVAHGAGIIHRDLKPDNLFLTEDGRVKVLDFGIARVLETAPDDLRTRTGMAMGTLPYMAPEQALGRRDEIDGRVDIFALGATAFRIITKRRVHEADSEAGLLVAMASKPAPPLRSVAEHVPENVAGIIDVALAFHRDARYPDARTMQEDVRAVQRAEPPPFAGARLRARDEATKVPLAATSPALGSFASMATQLDVAGPRLSPAPVASTPTASPAASAPNREPTAAPAPAAPAPQGPPSPPTSLQASPALLAAAALACLLLGGVLWAVWPSSSTPAAETVAEELEAEPFPAPLAAAAPARPLEEARESSQAEREHDKKQKEGARERRKKTDESLREQLKREAERLRERGKR